jgi:excisionase family DNA binding protein
MRIKSFNNLISPDRENLLSNDDAAAYIGVTPRTLEVWRCKKSHVIEYIKVGRLVKYRKEILDAWLLSNTVKQ